MYPEAKENKPLFFLNFLLKRKSAKPAKNG